MRPRDRLLFVADSPLLIVEEAVELTEPLGLTLTPNVQTDVEPGSYTARLVRPDGTQQTVDLGLEWTHFNPGGFMLVARVPGGRKSDFPPGTKVFLD